MTRLTFIGTGEAFDPYRVNSSYLLEHNKSVVLVDCGYDVNKSVMRYAGKTGRTLASIPHALLLTHEHGDHIASIPALVYPMLEEIKRSQKEGKLRAPRKFTIASVREDLLEKARAQFTDYPGLFTRLGDEGLILEEKVLGAEDNLLSWHITSAITKHTVTNHAYRLTDPTGASVAISGDGDLIPTTRELYRGVDVLIHEGFTVKSSPGTGHGSIEDVINFAIEEKIPQVHIVHVNRYERRKNKEIAALVKKAYTHGVNVSLPKDHTSITI